jgi:hypothetical protein
MNQKSKNQIRIEIKKEKRKWKGWERGKRRKGRKEEEKRKDRKEGRKKERLDAEYQISMLNRKTVIIKKKLIDISVVNTKNDFLMVHVLYILYVFISSCHVEMFEVKGWNWNWNWR